MLYNIIIHIKAGGNGTVRFVIFQHMLTRRSLVLRRLIIFTDSCKPYLKC